jgi:hypothetical protein
MVFVGKDGLDICRAELKKLNDDVTFFKREMEEEVGRMRKDVAVAVGKLEEERRIVKGQGKEGGS